MNSQELQVTLSIGVPAYNQGTYLKSTIKSLLEQTVTPHEIVISDNWSTDETYQVASSFGSRVKLIRPPRHLGMMEHWNFLVKNLQGNWFSIISSDDEAKPNFTEEMLKGIRTSDNAVLIRSGYEIIDGDGNTLDKRYILSVRKVCSPPYNFYEQLSGPRVNFSAFAVRKRIWQKVGGFPVLLNLSGDWGLWLLIAPYGSFVYQHNIVSRYRTEYRSSIKTERLLAVMQDDANIYQVIIPAVLKNINNPNLSTVARASRKRCFGRLIIASNIENSETRQTALSILQPWAEQTGQLEVWNRVQSGERLAEAKRGSHIRAIVRRIYQHLRSI